MQLLIYHPKFEIVHMENASTSREKAIVFVIWVGKVKLVKNAAAEK